MLRVLYIDVVEVDRDVAHVGMAIHVSFQVYVPNVSSVLNICCKHMFQVFHTYVCKCFILMSHMFVMIFSHFRKCFRRLFQCLICLFWYIATTVYVCFKSRSGVTYGIRVGSSWRHRRRLGRCGHRLRRRGRRPWWQRTHCWCVWGEPRASHSLPSYADNVRTLAPRSDIRTLAKRTYPRPEAAEAHSGEDRRRECSTGSDFRVRLARVWFFQFSGEHVFLVYDSCVNQINIFGSHFEY
jgi:hypothetical protein